MDILFCQTDSMKSVLFGSFYFINLCSDLVYGLVLMTRQIVYLCDESIKILLIYLLYENIFIDLHLNNQSLAHRDQYLRSTFS